MRFDKEVMKDLIEKNLLDFVGTRSDTNSKEEKNIEGFFKQWFSKIEYFQNNPEHYGLFEIPDDYLGRKVPWCLLKGKGKDTIVFIHHNDIVETKDYGTLEPLCLKPYELMESFKVGKMQLPSLAKEDLLSGKWIFGRGVSDMKGGGSIQLSLIEEYSKDSSFKGNIVLISVPDEENLSAGMRGAALHLKALKDKYDLEYKLMLNSEPHERGDDLRPTLYDGSIGKIMPVVYVRGKLAHVGQVYSGLNPINLLSEIIRRTELNPNFIEKVGNTTNPPPTWLYHKDRKMVYDVSLPIASCGYMSILPLKRTPKSIMDELKNISIESFQKVIEDMNASYKLYTNIAGLEFEKFTWEPDVKFYSELYSEAIKDSGEDFENAYENLMVEIKEKFNSNKITTIEAANTIIEKTLEYVKDVSPCVILALTPPYYPSTNNNMLGEKSTQIYEIIEDIKKYAKDHFHEEYIVQNYFTGISDLSYSMFVSDQSNIDYIANNMLMWKDVYYIPLEVIKEISMPVINIGPWGRDLHKYTERVYKEDLFYKTPKLIDLFVSRLLENY
ncbi:M20/M25/M40 family metallo-hydrolase [uncultured Tissierella sp.]|uniref:M20/M25/M40 family metallo-hydrolase n=1 Tax=uncultured Tissierella sp. TaxID=448160 RepID=UPI002803F086|nr:M20/M25/M40 family metallo-hydrolase [uncultured Tissierella sp.]MDU5082236.1 M20/M25/M40 family metallo-hydrolase [Bacillota bacterium]